jgi:abequosyltransferase
VSEVLLSLCIPTFNRCEILETSLNYLFADPGFNSDLIEVVVSDNCSTDQTESVVAKFPLVRYFKNGRNIQDENVIRVLNNATGSYLKIVNDTFRFKEHVLLEILEILKNESDLGRNVFFFQNFIDNVNVVKYVNNLDELFTECSYYTTWLACTGFWRKDYINVLSENHYTVLRFPQLHYMYEVVSNGKPTVVYFKDMFEIVLPQRKGGYNFFRTWINDYLSIVKGRNLKFGTLQLEKYRLLKYHIIPRYEEMRKDQTRFDFNTQGMFFYLIREYWYLFYMYPLIFNSLRRNFSFRLHRFISIN